MFVIMLTASVMSLMPGISISVLSAWFCLDSKSDLKRSGLGLKSIQVLYWCVLSGIHCSLCSSVAVFMKVACGLS